MKGIVTLEELLNVEETLNNIVKDYDYKNDYIDEEICNQYNTLSIKASLTKLFNHFKSARYLYDFSIDEKINITSNYEIKVEQFQQSCKSADEYKVDNNIDKKILTTNIYYSLKSLCKNITGDEFIYLMGTFFKKQTEEDIADLIGISKTYLQKVKKSCLIKSWTFLNKYCKD